MVSKRDQKKIEFDAFVEVVKQALADAHTAAASEYDAYASTAKRTKDGFMADACGSASVVVYNPSYRFREALKQLGEIEAGYQGAWRVSRFWQHVKDQGITGHEVACNAALKILEERFPDEGKFYAPSRID